MNASYTATRGTEAKEIGGAQSFLDVIRYFEPKLTDFSKVVVTVDGAKGSALPAADVTINGLLEGKGCSISFGATGPDDIRIDRTPRPPARDAAKPAAK